MDFIFDFVTDYGVWAVIILIFLEYACFPLPSEVVLPFSGAVALSTGTNFFVIFAASILASNLGSLLCYAIGYYGGTAFLEKFKKKFPSSVKGLNASEEMFNKYSSMAVCLTRLIPLSRTYISFIAGAGRQKLTSFIGFSTIGIAIWNGILLFLGYKLGDNWTIVTTYYDKFKVILIPIIIVAVIAVGVYVIYKKKKEKKINTI